MEKKGNMPEFDTSIIVRYLTGEASESDLSELESWLLEDRSRIEELADFETIYDARKAIDYASGHIAVPSFDNLVKRRGGNSRKSRIWRGIAVMAAVAAVLAVAMISVVNIADSSRKLEFRVADGENVKEIRLQDGTMVWLNTGSSMEIDYGLHGREVRLEGEGYFSVTKDAKRPFVVITDDYSVYVTGTEFNVKAYDYDYCSETVLMSGKVEIRDSEGKTLRKLVPGQMMKYDRINDMMYVSSCDTENVGIWKDGWLSFDGMDLNGVFRQLSKVYNIPIIVSPDMKSDVTVNSGIIRKVKYIDSVLDDLQFVFPFEYNYSPDGILISPSGKKDR